MVLFYITNENKVSIIKHYQMVKSQVQFFLRKIRLLSFFLLPNLRHQFMFMDERELLSNKNCIRYSPKWNAVEPTWKKKEKINTQKIQWNVPSVCSHEVIGSPPWVKNFIVICMTILLCSLLLVYKYNAYYSVLKELVPDYFVLFLPFPPFSQHSHLLGK